MDQAGPRSAPDKAMGGAAVIFWGDLISGTLDISAAFISAALITTWGRRGVLRSVAGTLLEPDARDNGGWAVPTFGVALHYSIATG